MSWSRFVWARRRPMWSLVSETSIDIRVIHLLCITLITTEKHHRSPDLLKKIKVFSFLTRTSIFKRFTFCLCHIILRSNRPNTTTSRSNHSCTHFHRIIWSTTDAASALLTHKRKWVSLKICRYIALLHVACIESHFLFFHSLYTALSCTTSCWSALPQCSDATGDAATCGRRTTFLCSCSGRPFRLLSIGHTLFLCSLRESNTGARRRRTFLSAPSLGFD